MKKITSSIAFTAIILGITSCGGWSASQENAFNESCEKAGGIDCPCALEAVKKAYPNNSDFVEKGAKDTNLQAEILKCSK